MITTGLGVATLLVTPEILWEKTFSFGNLTSISKRLLGVHLCFANQPLQNAADSKQVVVLI